MSSKKREIYARAAVQLRTHERPAHAESMCPGAMGMYLFLLLQARGEGSDGDVSEVIALAHWSHSSAYRKKQVEALVAAGLVERRDGRLVVVKYGEHNDTSTAIEENRKAAVERQRVSRDRRVSHGSVTRDSDVTHTDVPISSSISSSKSSDPEPDSAREADPAGGPASVTPPPWFLQAVGTAEMAVGDIGDVPARWLSYQASRERKGWAPGQKDAVGWLCDAVRGDRDRRSKAGSGPDLRAVADAGPARGWAPLGPPTPPKSDDAPALAVRR